MTAAGWYPDPQQPARARYWDGARWTGHLYEFAVEADGLPPPVAAQPAAPDARTQAAPADGLGLPSAEPAPPTPASLTPQRVLLGLGAALLIAAAAAFIAFTWTVVGAGGRAALITLLAAVFLGLAVRVRLTAVRETFCVVGLGTLAVEVGYGSSVGLIPDGFFDHATPWLSLTLAAASAGCWALGTWARLVSARVVAAVTYVLAVLSLLDLGSAHLPSAVTEVVFSGGLALAAAATILLPRAAPWPSIRAWTGVVLGVAALFGLAVSVLGWYAAPPDQAPSAWWVAGFAVVAGSAWSAGRWAPAAAPVRPVLTALGAAAAGGAVGIALSRWPSTVPAAAIAAVAGFGVVFGAIHRRRAWPGVAGAAGLWVVWLGSSGLVTRATDDAIWAWGVFAATGALLALGFGMVGREPRVVIAFGPLSAIAGWLLLVATAVTLVEAYAAVVTVACVVPLAVCAWRGVLARADAFDLGCAAVFVTTLPSAAIATVADVDAGIAGTEWLSLAVAALGIIGAFVAGAMRPRLRWLAAFGSAVLLVELWTLAGDLLPGDPTVEYVAWTAFACYAAAAAIVVPQHRRTAIGWGALVALCVSVVPAALWAWDQAADGVAVVPWLSVAFTTTAVVALVALGLRRRQPWPFVAAGALAWPVLLGLAWARLWPDDARVPFVVTGALALLCGAGCRVVSPRLHSLWWLGLPGLLVAVPFALDPGTDPSASPVGFVALVVGAAGFAAVGAWRRVAGLLMPGSVALAIVVVDVLADAAAAVPAWVWLAVAGAVLLTVGVRLEATRVNVRRGAHWLRSLD